MNFSAGIGSAISGAFGLLGQGLSNRAQKKIAREYNRTQQGIAQMNNEWNSLEAAKNRDFQRSTMESQQQWAESMWNKENEYNTASNQRKRLEEAGLNPYLMMNGGNAGVATSASAGPAAAGSQATATTPNQIAPDIQYDFSSVSDAINSFFINQKQVQDYQLQDQFGPDLMKAWVASLVNGRFEFLSNDYRRGRMAETPNLLGADISSHLSQSQSVEADIALKLAQATQVFQNAETQKIINKYLPAQQQADLSVKAATIYSAYASGDLSKEKARESIKQQVLISAQSAGKRIDNKVAERIADAQIDAMNEELKGNAIYYRELRQYQQNLARSKGSSDILENQLKESLNARKKADADDLRYQNKYMRAFKANLTDWIKALLPLRGFSK
ncbi:MAG: hypothetical protein O2U61_02890 [Candidatus Bathyarchaeota archaeon]|nr:hypothetical protein [Candidatus Bathyarchaeota archaeon]